MKGEEGEVQKGLVEDTEDAAKDYLAQFGLANVEDLPQTQVERLKEALIENYDDKERFINVARRMGIESDRADLIFDNEMHEASSNAELDSARALGAITKTWESSGHGNVCPECDRMNGETVPIDQPFSNGMMAAHAHPGCFCGLSYSYGSDLARAQP